MLTGDIFIPSLRDSLDHGQWQLPSWVLITQNLAFPSIMGSLCLVTTFLTGRDFEGEKNLSIGENIPESSWLPNRHPTSPDAPCSPLW